MDPWLTRQDAGLAARLLAVTQLLESLARAGLKNANNTDLQPISNVAAILLRDSCDLLGVMGWRLQA
ncbi:short-chain dehydrogenase [Pseudomonas sp. NFXW11]